MSVLKSDLRFGKFIIYSFTLAHWCTTAQHLEYRISCLRVILIVYEWKKRNVCEIEYKCYHCKIQASIISSRSCQHKCISVVGGGRLQCCPARWHACDFSVWLGVVLSCTVQFRHVMRSVQYTVRNTVTFGARLYSIRVQDTVTTGAVTSAG